jgi:two-component system sensor histidine kinase KdpD
MSEDNDLTRRMFSSFSHDLKTPLASIIGSLEVLSMMHTKLSEEKRTILIETSLNESHRLDRYVSNILELSKLELGLVNKRVEQIHIKDAIDEALLLAGRLKHKAIIKLLNVENEIIIDSDLKLLARMIDILIENAIIHSAESQNGESVKIDIWYENKNNKSILAIRDYGTGIPIESFDEIFEKYSRIKHMDRKNTGTGLGLSIAREIGKLIDIDISVSNHPKGGAIFEIVFK